MSTYRPEWYHKNKIRLRAAHKKWAEENKELCREYQRRQEARRRKIVCAFKNVPCADCGRRFPSECMDFDHVRGKKLFDVTAGVRNRLDKVMAEIAKCEIVCANCHRIRTKRKMRRRRWRK